jgi:hypothetical protein
MADSISEIEKASFTESPKGQVPPSDIVAYNELRSCADLYRMHLQSILDIQPDFQREVVWKGPAQTRFIDSLVKQLPIPSMCFAMDYQAQKWIVIDGLQRMFSIVKFLEGGTWRLSALEDIDQALAGRLASEFKSPRSDLRHFYTRVENLSIPITVLRCDFTKKSHMDYLFTIFHRLNTGGMKLNNQEIRNCIYGGEFNLLLKELDDYPSWRKLNKMKSGDAGRFTKQEIILRAFAFHDRSSSYEGDLAGFLNDYMQENRNPSQAFLDKKKQQFEQTMDCIVGSIFEGSAPPNKLSVTLLEALMVGVSKNLSTLSQQRPSMIRHKYKELANDEEFSEQSLKEGLSKKQRVITRINTAIRIFRG